MRLRNIVAASVLLAGFGTAKRSTVAIART